MSAFSPIDSDIDRTPRGVPYVVDSDGWGWWGLILLLLLPLLVIGAWLKEGTEWIQLHAPAVMCMFGGICLLAGMCSYRNRTARHRLLGKLAVSLAGLSLGMIQFGYLVPYMKCHSEIESAVEWLLLTAIVVGAIIFITAIMRLLQNGLLHFLLSSVLFVGTTLVAVYHVPGREAFDAWIYAFYFGR